jgi:tripartite-type tricarboxylate transporter receptor subunit TctC
MKLFKKSRIACMGLALGLVAAQAMAQAWPTKSIRLIVPAPAGSAPDIAARIIGDKLSKTLGQQVLIDNKPGAGGIVAMNLLKAAPNDGYTMTLAQAAVLVVTPFTYKEASYDAERDFDSVAMVGISPMVFVANPNHPAKNLTDAIAMVRAKPEAVSVGNPTRTSIPHLAAELMGLKTGTKFQQVSFANTGQGVQAVVNGDINMYVDGGGPLVALVKAGRMKMLAVASETELPGFEGIPLANKSVPGLNVSGWFMMLAPKGTPAAVVQRVNADVNKAMQEPDVQAKFREFVLYPTPGSVADTQKFLSQQKALFGGVIRDLGLKPE